MKNSYLIALFLTFFCMSFAFTEEMPQLEHLRIQKIEVEIKPEGSQTQEASLLARLKTKEGALFSQEDLDVDLKVLAKEYDRIEPQIQVVNGALYLKLQIWLKPHIHSITWEGNKEISQEKLASELSIHPGMLFDRPTFNKAFHKLKNYYIKKGYFEAELDYTVHPEVSGNEVNIQINIKEGRSGTIDEIVFHDITKKEENDLLDLIFTKKYNFFTSWLTQEGTHNPEVLRHDEMTILSYLQNEGYADAKVKTVVHEAKKPGRIVIDVDIHKGQLYHVDDVSIEGNTIMSTEDLLARLPIKKGEIYSQEKVRQSVKAIQDTYGSRGYIDVIVTPESQLAKEGNSYTTRFYIQENDRYRVGLVKVFGNTRTDISVILHEILLTPGEVFDSQMLAKSEERLRNVGYFKNVNIYAVKSSQAELESSHFRDVYVEVEENPTTARFSFFGAFNTTESISGGVNFNETNFNSKGVFSLFDKGLKAMRGGGEYLSFGTTIGRKILLYNLSWTKPYFMDTPWIVGMDASKLRNSYSANDYSIKSYSVQLFASYPLNAFVKAGMQYRLRHSFVTLKGIRHTPRNEELIRESKNGGLISAFGPTVSYDSTDHPQIPRRGVRSTLSGEYAGGDHHFLKASYLNSMYWAPYEFGLFRLRGNAQFIQTLGSTNPRDLPLDERLYLGGEQSMRGYLFNRVGPQFHDKNHTPRGGISSLLFSCDYDQYLFKKLDGYVFMDVGNVYFSRIDPFTLRFTAGYGIKVKVFGNTPLVLGIGYPLNPENKRDVRHFFFTIGTAF